VTEPRYPGPGVDPASPWAAEIAELRRKIEQNDEEIDALQIDAARRDARHAAGSRWRPAGHERRRRQSRWCSPRRLRERPAA
jgi:hypothetical protein